MNAAGAIERVLARRQLPWTWQDLVSATWNMERPVLPAPHQVALDFWSAWWTGRWTHHATCCSMWP
jgi:NitT/TauT family transport system permease protein